MAIYTDEMTAGDREMIKRLDASIAELAATTRQARVALWVAGLGSLFSGAALVFAIAQSFAR